ncbi:phosphoglycerate kinase, partial [bacterium]|nr:phosphoglycerate kinase [bacterium]
MFTKQTINDVDLRGKFVLLRADYNVPLDKDGNITSDYRIKQSLPTIMALKDAGCKIVICSHLGRPTGPDDKSCSLKPIAKRLSELLGEEVMFLPDCVGDATKQATAGLQNGQVALVQNLRYYKEEEQNNEDFARVLVQDTNAELFVQDGFGVVHRAHASTDAITHFLPAVSGLLLEREVDTITNVMSNPDRPLMAIIGGAKIADKIEIIHIFLDIADVVVIGGAMANTFLLAQGIKVGDSLVDKDDLFTAKEIIQKAQKIATE